MDLWGVMHNGKALFEPAVVALKAAKAQGLSVTLLSNAPRRRDAALDNLTGRLGLDSTLFDDLITSGEVAWQDIHRGSTSAWGPRAYFFGAPKDADMKLGLPSLTFVKDLDQADWILNVGPDSGQGDVTPFQPWIAEALAHNLPMVCANPDLIVQRGNEVEICAGAVARAYADQGGDVTWYGKPYAAVYEAVYASSGLAADQMLAVGDSFKTDMRGATQQGMDCLYVNTGIHRGEVGAPIDMQEIRRLAQILC